MMAMITEDGSPQPASAPMSKEQAERLVAVSKGRLTAQANADGEWVLYDTEQPSTDAQT